MEAAIKAKAVQASVGAQKRLLVDIPGIVRIAEQIQGPTEHSLVVGAHQLLEGVLVASLRSPDQIRFIHCGC